MFQLSLKMESIISTSLMTNGKWKQQHIQVLMTLK